MIVEIISTGSELLLGQIVNSNASYLAKQLNELGFSVLFQSTVGDNSPRMTQVFNTALQRADIIISTGGLGPTLGDITKNVAAKMLGRQMYLHEPSVEHIRSFFAKRNMSMPDSNLRQAMIPEGAKVLENALGTAPGIVLEAGKNTIIHLPGPPVEMEAMFETSVKPYLLNRFGFQGTIQSLVLRTFGISESLVEKQLEDIIKKQGNPTIALLARNGEIHIRITAKADTANEARRLIASIETTVRQRLREYIFGVDDETLEVVVGRLLKARGLSVAFAESCTGGLVSSRITDIAGSSDYMIGSVVCYSNDIKINAVGVNPQILEKNGAVSPETATAMANGIRARFNSDIGVGITGIAGPSGAVTGKPVGLVYIAVAGQNSTQCHRHNFTGQRITIKMRSAHAALNHLRQYIELL